MFRCGLTGKVSESGERGVRIVTERRQKTYYGLNKDGEQVEVGQGWEIVKEALILQSVDTALELGLSLNDINEISN